MAIDLSDDTKVGTEEETPQSETQSEFSKLVQGVEQSTEEADEPEETQEEETEEVEEPTPQPQVVEGPSSAGRMAAEAAGIPAMIINAVKDDDALYGLIQQLSEHQPAEDDASPFELELPEDEYPENDPVRGALTKLQSHFNEQLSQMKSQLKETAGKAETIEKQTSEAVKQQHKRMQSEFDGALDALGASGFGNTKSMTQANFHLRKATFDRAQELQADNPDKSMADLAVMAAEEFGITNNKKASYEKDAIRNQAKRRLGGGQSQPADPEVKSPEEMMRNFLIERDLIRG